MDKSMQQAARKYFDENASTKNLPVDRLEEIHTRIRAIGERALEHIPPAKIQAKAADFLSSLHESPDVQLRAIDALGYALDLALFTPSMTGQTATDRLLRSGKINTPKEKEAADLLRNTVFRLIEITQDLGEGLFAAIDLASEENLILFDQKMPCRAGARWVLRTCLYGGAHVSVGPVTPLDDNMMQAAKPFMSVGRGLKNPLRCAEALYRNFIRFGNVMGGINPNLLGEEEFEFGYDENDGPIHALAAKWAAKEALPEPSTEDIRIIRGEAYLVPVREALSACRGAHELKLQKLATAYERILVIQLETIHRRNSSGIRTSHETLDNLAVDLQQAIAKGHIDSGAQNLFDDLCRRAKLACAAKTANKASRDELDKILARIQALRSKTVAQGCTEEEALLAASKVAEMLDRYGLSLSEVDMKEQSCAGEGIETDRRRRSPFDDCVGTIAEFCDCRSWYEMTTQGHIRHILFGLPADVAGARYLYDKIEEAFDTETRNFKLSDLYDSHPSSQRRTATASFQAGLGHGIRTKLDKLKEARTAKAQASGGRDLVPMKNGVIEGELADLGLKLRAVNINRGKRLLSKAYHSGRVTGENLEWEERIEG